MERGEYSPGIFRRRAPGASIVFLVLGCLLVPLAVIGIWVHTVFLDTERYLNAVTPLIGRSDVQRAISRELAGRLLTEFDLREGIAEVWPNAPETLVEPVVAQVEYYTELLSFQLVSSDTFVPLWSAANREAHLALVNMINGQGPMRLTTSGVLVVDLGEAAAELARRIQEAAIPLPDALLPSFPGGEIAVMRVDGLQTLSPALAALADLYLALPIVAVLCLVLAILLAGSRWRTLAFAGVGVVLTMILLEAGLSLGHGYYLASADEAGVPEEISRSMWRPLAGSLDSAARLILLVGVAVVVSAALVAVWRARERRWTGK